MRKPLTAAIGLVLAALSCDVLAITDTETNASIPFSFTSPGARSLGMAGAFVGLADDATAAYTNPAGLTQLRQTEISLEGRHTQFDTPFVDGGTFTEAPFNDAGIGTGHDSSAKTNPSFLSVVFPFERWALALYRHELARYHTEFTNPNALEGDTIFLFPFSAKADLKIVNYGVSAGFKVNDALSLGVGLSRYDFKFDTIAARFDYDNAGNAFPVSAQQQQGDDNGIGWNLGARWSLSESMSLGAIYRRAPRFDYDAAAVLLDPNGAVTASSQFRGVRFDVPDVWGAGLTWRPSDAWLVSFDLDRVRYSQLTDGIQSLFAIQSSTDRLQIPDGTEIHLGTEYTWTDMAHPFSLRGGVWRDPRHSIEFSGTRAAAAPAPMPSTAPAIRRWPPCSRRDGARRRTGRSAPAWPSRTSRSTSPAISPRPWTPGRCRASIGSEHRNGTASPRATRGSPFFSAVCALSASRR